MKSVSWNSTTAYLIDEKPNMAFRPVLTASIPTEVEQGLQGFEARLKKGESLRLKFQFTITLQNRQQIATFRNALQSLLFENVLCPLWPAMRKEGDTHPVSSGWYAVISDTSSAVYASGSVPSGLSDDSWIVPLMVGRFTAAPDPNTITTEGQHVEISFEESNVYSLTLASYSAPLDGPTVNGVTPKVWPFRHQANEAPSGGGTSRLTEWSVLGESRKHLFLSLADPGHRVERRSYVLVGDTTWQMLRYYQDSCTDLTWLPASTSDANLTADVASVATSIPVDDVTARGANQYMILDDGSSRTPFKVTANSGSSWTISAAIGTAFTAQDSQIFNLIPARMAGGVQVTFWNTDLAECDLSFVEAPQEIATNAFETVGTTSGSVGTRAYLYTYSIDDAAGYTRFWRYTDYESDLTYGGNTYTGNSHITHNDIQESLGLGGTTVQIEHDWHAEYDRPPIHKAVMFLEFDFPLNLEIREVSVSGSTATSKTCWFYGSLIGDGLRSRGRKINATFRSHGSIVDARLPHRMIQLGDNWQLFDSGNGLVMTDWDYDGNMTSYSGLSIGPSMVVSGLTLNGGSAGSIGVDELAGGMVYVINTPGDGYWRSIAGNTALSGGSITLKIERRISFSLIGGSTPCKIYPPYDGTYQQCVSKFNNRSRFGGFPFIPAGNPSMVKVSKNVTTGGKK